ncbi:MAG: Coq4 family protein [Sphingomonadaceae bacterium]
MTTAHYPAPSGIATQIADDNLPFWHNSRPPLKLRPLKAWKHFRNLLRDKENTEEVFYIFEALPTHDVRGRAQRFLTSDHGRQLRLSEPYLPDLLDDHAMLRAFPADSVAHAYLDFMESQGLTAAGLVEEYDQFREGRTAFDDKFEWYISRYRDTHDLLHVLTGYNRDALGEQCVLAFTHGQNGGLGYLFIAYAAALHMRGNGAADAPVIRAVREAQKLGKGCPTIAEMPIEDVLAMPLEEARSSFGIRKPRFYDECHAQWRDKGIDPYTLLTTG